MKNKMCFRFSAVLVLLALGFSVAAATLPPVSLNPKLPAPIKTWDEAIPLGNGAMGVLLWGDQTALKLSLDRGDLWDERPSKAFQAVRSRFNYATMRRLVAENKMEEFNSIFDSNYDYNGPPTKLPAGRMEIVLDTPQPLTGFELNLASAEGIAHYKGGNFARVLVGASDVTNPVALIDVSGPELKEVRLQAPESVKLLGYPPAVKGGSNDFCWFEQTGADGFSYAVCAGWKRDFRAALLAVTVATSREGTNPLAIARARVESALAEGYEKKLGPHTEWWREFWEHSSVTLPEQHILQQYYTTRYFYGAASRRGAPPMPLQGVWSADAGTLPPWKGDYHNDLNTQMTYLAYRTSGDFDEGACFLDLLWNLLPTFRKFALDFYGVPGAAVPGVMSLAGQPLGGWGQYSLSPTMGAWTAHLFYLHWRHTGDDTFLRERAYPFCREIGTCLRDLLQVNTNGLLTLPLSSSPEVFDNSRGAFLKPNSNFDLACMKMLFVSLAEMAEVVGDTNAIAGWISASASVGAFHTGVDSMLLLDEATPLPSSHRHLSNLMGIYPFNLITIEGGREDRDIIRASIADWDRKGTSAWCGYSFTWMSCLRARIGDAEAAVRYLDIFTRAFILPNGFHANGDQTTNGWSTFTYRPFTLEGNFLAMEAVHEMLLQSWSAHPGTNEIPTIRLFPAVPWRWHDVAFENLRAENGYRVSARRENNATTWFRIEAAKTGRLKIRDNLGHRSINWNRKDVEDSGNNFEVVLKAGEAVEAFISKPEQIPDAPPNAAQPIGVLMRSTK